MTAAETSVNRGGRPRDASRDGAILRGVMAVLATEGLLGLSMDDVAAEAGVGKATIYRRWRSREEVLAATLRACQPVVAWPDGSLAVEAHLVALLYAHTRSVESRAALALLSSLPLHDDLAQAWADGPAAALLTDIGELLERTRATDVRAVLVARALSQLRMQYLLGQTPTDLDFAVAARNVIRDHRALAWQS